MNNTYNSESPLEEIKLDDEPQFVHRISAPKDVAFISYRGNDTLYLNVKAASIVSASFIRFASAGDYIILFPATASSFDAFKCSKVTHGQGKSIRCPEDLKAKKIAHGAHRLYKYKDGYCFKRNVIIDAEGVERDA